MNYFASSAFPEVNKNQPSLNWITCMKKLSQRGEYSPMYLPSVERLCVEGHCGRVAALDTVDGDFAPQLHPGHSEDGAGVGTGQCEDVLLVVLEEIKDSYGEKETELLKSVRQDMMRAATRIFFFFFLKLIVRMNCLSNPRVWTPFSKKFKSGEECQHSWFACTPSVFVWKHNQLSK